MGRQQTHPVCVCVGGVGGWSGVGVCVTITIPDSTLGGESLV